MSHKKVKTQPCLSPESPFVRKPSKEALQRLTLNRQKPKESEKVMMKNSEYFGQQNIANLAFIPSGSVTNFQSLKNDSTKLKKTTIDLGTFRIKHDNMVLKNQMQELKEKNQQLVEENEALRKQNEDLKKQLEGQSRISKFSSETLEHTDTEEVKKLNNFNMIGSQQSLLEIHNYEILPSTLSIENTSSLLFDDQLKSMDECNFLSTSISRKLKPQLSQPKLSLRKSHSYRQEIEILSKRIECLEQQLRVSMLKEKQVENENESLRLCASMSKRKLEVKDSELKEMKIKERKKQYFEKFFELSSEEDNEYR